MTGHTLRWQHLKHAANMTGLTVDQIMIARKRKTSNQVVKGRWIDDGRSVYRIGKKTKKRRKQQTQQSKRADFSCRHVLPHWYDFFTPYIHMRLQIRCSSAVTQVFAIPNRGLIRTGE